MCLEEEYFGKMPPVCDARIPLPDIPYHGNSVQTFSWMKRLGKVPKAPNTLYREPLTTSQHYGWFLPRHPEERLEVLEPWTRTARKPLIQSEMTKFLSQMMRTDPGFWLF
ncbi:testis-expressed protein 49-like [Leucoraja erinacea]|uniref:testis-expressed protein 49-like n=1 Tax=Leucoraja erinaceus TaxID=7782 RepID=UPI002454AED4|nr:testis-expressed protein 49-like [Leucoraja erinacea]